MQNVTGTSRRVLPGEIEIARPKKCSYLRAFMRAGAAAGQRFKFQRVVYRGRRYHPEPRAPSTAAFLRSRGHPGAPRGKILLFLSRRRASEAERVSDVDVIFCGRDPLMGPCVLRILILRVPVYHMSRVNSRCSAVLSNDPNIET